MGEPIRHKSDEIIACPFCGSLENLAWAEENGFTAVKCAGCELIFVNPRPSLSSINDAVRTGVHSEGKSKLRVVNRRISAKVTRYRKIFASMFGDVWNSQRTISWLDVGAGYGEVVEAVSGLAPAGSKVQGLEPMRPKAAHARARGLAIIENYLHESQEKVDFLSVIDVFSHIPNFGDFLRDVKNALTTNGEIFIETGNLADLFHRSEFPGELGLPDHLVFAGERHIRGFLQKAGFEIVKVKCKRIDGITFFLKNVVKKALGRPVVLAIPYTSPYRTMMFRAVLRSK